MDNNFLQLISEHNQLKSVKKTNEYTNQYGLSLSDCDVHELMNRRREALVRQQRIEFGGGILEKIIHAFCDSCYIYQDIYADTIARLQDIFYYYKNESMDQLTDDELIDIMREAFDGECQGSLEYLEETYLEKFARNVRANSHNIIGNIWGTINTSPVTDIYSMQDLIPLVGKLAEEFTGKESTSVTYERAKQLMESVIYCIAHVNVKNNSLMEAGVMPAEEAYRLGFCEVIEKTRKTQERYNELIGFFDSYGNRNYEDTVQKALPGFFLYYDVKYAPTDNIITMDYPVFGLDMNLEGIDMISQYIDAIWEEQCYLMNFSRDYIISALRSFHPRYEKEFYNIREIVDLYGDCNNK